MKKLFCFLALFLGVVIIFGRSFAYNLPEDNSHAQYFCVFGLRSSSDDGADIYNPDQVFFFDVPESQIPGLTVDIFDPDTGGSLDQKDPNNQNWETIFQFAVYGKEGALLDKKRFGESPDYDRSYYRFGPYPKEMGHKIGEVYRFKLVVSPVKTFILKGDDLNLFGIRVSPDDVEAFSEKISLRLSTRKGREICFYPLIPAGASEIIVENYDLDPDGGLARLYDPLAQKKYEINNSGSGVWAQTAIQLSAADAPRRLSYIITKKTQQNGNASVRVKDSQGNLLPIYFSQQERGVVLPDEKARLTKKNQQDKSVSIRPEGKAGLAPRKSAVEDSGKAVVEDSRKVAVEKPIKAAVVLSEKPSVSLKHKKPAVSQPIKADLLQCNKFTFDGTASFDPNNDKLSFFWDFGDSTTSAEPVVTHVFEKGGEYKVSLTVKDTSGLDCDSSSTTQTIKVNLPPAPAFICPEKVCVNQAVNFDASATADDTPETLSYVWDFTDGASLEGRQITRKFDKGGTYTVKLTVNDNANTVCSKSSISKTIIVNTPPNARSGGDIRMCIPADKDYSVVFDAGRSSDPDGDSLSYSWDFGDGQTASGKKVTHVYKTGGNYISKLTVDDGRGLDCSASQEVASVILNKQPVAVAGEDKIACPGTGVVFDGSGSSDADGDSLTYSWDFGDGASAQGAQVEHSFEKPGKYRVALSVDDNMQTSCSSATASLNVTVNTPPKAALEKPAPACLGDKVVFDASRTRGADTDGYKYTWDFGDGTVIEGPKKVTHEYKKGGKYAVKVTVDDKRNTACSTDSAGAEVLVNTPPVAKGQADFACCIDTESVFDGSASWDADGDTLAYQWDLGDGSIARGVKVTHRYSKGGSYTVTLKVDDNSSTSCAGSQTSFQVQINDQPVPVIKVR